MTRKLLPPLLTLAALLCGCTGGRNAQGHDAAPPPPGHALGTVSLTHAAEGCPVLVALEPPGTLGHLIPVGLDAKYRKEGLRLSFTYTLSRINSGGCAMGTPAVLDSIAVR
ncbi:MAG: hypothetical protein IT228_15255 [Flavobacteriales bacterium]|nr:hypothetical protein [Flavobacteriales bacterium]MCC6578697.1 hypothetical protein [Flavobacteriales bacterium]NUQ16438.1 hypothetical protein [Flavobacteriales bacterium]